MEMSLRDFHMGEHFCDLECNYLTRMSEVSTNSKVQLNWWNVPSNLVGHNCIT
jgi:hypothetical protein